MTIAEEFKEKIKAGKFTEALTLAVSECVSFKVTTWISQDQYITTSVDLVEGKIDNEIAEKILANQAYQQLCQLHFDQVQQGQQIIFNNLNSLQAMLATLEQNSDWSSPELPTSSMANLPFEENSKHDSY